MGDRWSPGVQAPDRRRCGALCEPFPQQSAARPMRCDLQEPKTGPERSLRRLFLSGLDCIQSRGSREPRSGFPGGRGPPGTLGP